MQEIKNDKIDYLALKRIEIVNENNNLIPISTLWRDSSVVIIFLNHFGCISCKGHVDKVWSNKDKLLSKGTKIAFIGNGNQYALRKFKEQIQANDVPMFIDETLESYQACGFNRGYKHLLNYKTFKSIVSLYKQGNSLPNQSTNNGSLIQMGGIIAFNKKGIATYHYPATYVGDVDEHTFRKLGIY